MATTTVEIGCAMIGSGFVFPMVVARHAPVHELQTAIFQAHRYYYRCHGADATILRLFVAKDAATSTWPLHTKALDQLLTAPGAIANTALVRMRLLRPLDDDANLGTNFSVGGGRVHVLIQLLPRRPTLDPRAYDIHSTLLFHVLVDEGQSSLVYRSTSDAAREAEEKDHAFQHQLVAAYNCAVPTTRTNKKTNTVAASDRIDSLRCMLLDTMLPSDLVVAVHVFPRRNAFLLHHAFLPLDDVDDVANGLLLATPLAHAFENFQLCFVEDQTNDTWRLKLTDPTLRLQRLVDYMDNRTGDTTLSDLNLLTTASVALETMTFGALEGRALSFRSGVRPCWPCLNLHARLARAKASRDQWIAPWTGTTLDDFWSDGLTAVERMERLYARDAPFSE